MDSIFFIVSKLSWFILSPDSVFVLLLCLCLLFFWFKATKTALILLHCIVLASLLVTLMPVGKWVLYPLETRFHSAGQLPDDVDGILMLAGAEALSKSQYWRQPELGSAAERFTAFIHLIKKYPEARHVFTGGIGRLNQAGLNSADVARMLFQQQGMDVESIVFESKSRNTYENAVFSKIQVQPKPGETWILVTSAFHMPRSVGVFSKQDWTVMPYPVDHYTHPEKLFNITVNFAGNLRELGKGFHEWIGLTAYYLTGKTDRLFPGGPGYWN